MTELSEVPEAARKLAELRINLAILTAGPDGDPRDPVATLLVELAKSAIKAGWTKDETIKLVAIHMLVARQVFDDAVAKAGLPVPPVEYSADEVAQEVYAEVSRIASAG